MRTFNNILVTGGAGFIGSNLIRYLFGLGSLNPDQIAPFTGRIINLDLLTYAGNPNNLADVEQQYGVTAMGSENARYVFVQADICDRTKVDQIIQEYQIDTIIHLAAESHVDRSIHGPEAFIRTNVMGTFTLLDAARTYWKHRTDVLFHHVSTDEVYGSLGDTGYFTETTPYDPRSPYSASKAGSDHLVKAYHHTFGLPITLTNCSNNYGPYQFPEKLIPVMISNMVDKKSLPVYGDGKNIRDWLYVEDHNSAVWTVMNKGTLGQDYNIGGDNEWENIRLVTTLCTLVANKTGQPESVLTDLITYVTDRPGHDRRYAIDCTKIKNELGWTQSVNFTQGLEKTVEWYLSNQEWIDSIRTGAYKKWIEDNYSKR